jgi:signal transduction histidine kinase/ligand-binding sensor domain-containing protein
VGKPLPPAAAQALPALAAARRFVVDQWDTEHGLPQNTVNAIAETPDGYLWIGTFGGLARFDGVRFTLFPARLYPGIRSDRIQALAVDSSGDLWIGTERGLARYDGRQVTGFRHLAGLPDAGVTALRVDSRGDVWIGLGGGGLSRYHRGVFRHFGPADGLRGDRVTGIIADQPGSLFLIGPPGTARVDLQTLHVTAGPGLLPAPGLERPVHRDADGSVWYVRQGGVERWRGRTFDRYGAALGLRGAETVVPDLDGNYLVASARGLGYLHPDPPVANQLIALPDGRRDYTVRSVFVDREGTRWAGTDADGLLRLRARLFTVLTSADGLANDLPLAMLRDHAGRIWVGANCDKTSIIERGVVRRDPSQLGCIWAMAEGPDGVMWMAPYNGGLYRLEGRRVRHFTAKDGLANPLILAIHVDHTGTVWIGTAAGLDRLRDGRFTVFDTAQGLPENNVRMIEEDHEGALWIGTLGGLARLKDDHLTAYTTADGLGGNHVRAFYEDSAGVDWIGTYGGGLTRLKDGTFRVINSTDGLFDDVVSAILDDGRGNLWMSGNRGIFRARLDDLNAFADGRLPSVQSVGYGTADGLISAETNGGFQPAAMRTPDGRLWFPTVKGLAVVNPADAVPNPRPPGVVLEQVLVDGVGTPWLQGLRVPYDARRFEIRFTGLSSPAPEGITFRYRMTGVDSAWVYGGTARAAYYSRLRPGRYHFTVDAANRDGRWNGTGAGFDLRVIPPLWATWWFRTIAAIVLVAAVSLAVRLRLQRLRAAHAAQQEFSRRLIGTQEDERKRIATALHDSVGQDLLVVKNRAVLAMEQAHDPAAVQEQLRQIDEVITDAIRDTRAIAHNLRPYQLDRVGLGASIRAAVEKAARGSGIRFAVTAEDLDQVFPPDAQIAVFRIVQEGVNNILKHSGATEATVHAFRAEGQVRILIVDNGRGAGTAGPGFGLSGIAERVTLMGGRHEMESEPGHGTTLRITIPVAPERRG